MKIRNKKTGEIVDFAYLQRDYISSLVLTVNNSLNKPEMYKYNSLADLNNDWEDYEKPKIKKYWWISPLDCDVVEDDLKWNETEYDDEIDKFNVEIGNYFESKKEAKKAMEELKAWKRLKDKGFRFDGWYNNQNGTLGDYLIYANSKDITDVIHDLDLVFGGEE